MGKKPGGAISPQIHGRCSAHARAVRLPGELQFKHRLSGVGGIRRARRLAARGTRAPIRFLHSISGRAAKVVVCPQSFGLTGRTALPFSLLPYQDPSAVKLVLQDVDVITESTTSTSILTDATMVGQKKTRVMAAWAEQRGFTTSLQERLFAADFKLQPDEPAVALCGLDNAAGRRALDQVGFDLIVEAGLGRGYRDFRTMRLHLLPGRRPAAEIWKQNRKTEKIEDRPAYTKLLADGVLDRCGMTLLSGKAIGAPFVGSVAATLALSEMLRVLHGGPMHQLIDVDLLSLDQRVAARHAGNFAGLNSGFTLEAR